MHTDNGSTNGNTNTNNNMNMNMNTNMNDNTNMNMNNSMNDTISTNVGKTIRLIIDHHQRHAYTPRRTIISSLRTNQHEFITLIRAVERKMEEYGLRLVGMTDEQTVPVCRADKFFVIRADGTDMPDKRRRVACDDVLDEYIIVLVIMALENGMLALDRLLALLDRISTDRDMHGVVYEMKRMHYVLFRRREDVTVVVYGWRSKVEMGWLGRIDQLID